MSSTLPHTDRVIPPPKKRRPWRVPLLFLLLAMAFAGGYWMASKNIKPQQIFQPKKINSPYLAYVHRLHEAGLDSMPLGRKWLEAGKAALEDSTLLNLPVQLETFVDAASPKVLSFRFEANEGEMLHIQLHNKAGDEGQLFVEIFEDRAEEQPPTVILSEVHLAGEITYQVDNDGIYLIRLQPEMLIDVSFQLTVYKTASLAFPVQGKDRKAIMSFFGASRDGGRRKHKGVDIFAKKGTPILAAIDGQVSLRNGGLGGKTVWQRVSGMSLYYAHMDSQYVRAGQRVKVGDTLGTVGNTGNARHTPSHLHFGIYRRGKGAVDPLAFIDTNPKKPKSATFGDKKRKWGRVLVNQASMRNQPNRKSIEVNQLGKSTPLFVKADCGEWLWVEQANGIHGFIKSNSLAEVDRPLRTQMVEKMQPVHQFADTCSAICDQVRIGEEIVIYAENQHFYLIKKAGKIRWIKKSGKG